MVCTTSHESATETTPRAARSTSSAPWRFPAWTSTTPTATRLAIAAVWTSTSATALVGSTRTAIRAVLGRVALPDRRPDPAGIDDAGEVPRQEREQPPRGERGDRDGYRGPRDEGRGDAADRRGVRLGNRRCTARLRRRTAHGRWTSPEISR